MENKKITMIAMATLAIVTFAFAYVFVVQRQKETKKTGGVAGEMSEKKSDLSKIDFPKMECGQLDDPQAYKQAIVEKNIDFCGCIKADSHRDTCQETILDANLASQALSQMDQEICKEIKQPQRRESCISMTKQGVEYLKSNNPEKLAHIYAISHNEKSIEQLEGIKEKNVGVYINLALSYAEKGLKEQEQGRNQLPFVEKALESIEKAKFINSNDSEVYRVEAYVNEIKPDFERSLLLYNKAIELDGKNMHAYAGRGHLRRLTSELLASVDDFYKAAELDSKKENIFIYANLCNLEYSRGKYQEALKNCAMATKLPGTDIVFQSEAHQIMAIILLDNLDLIQARSHLLKAKGLTPNDPNLFVTFSKLNIFEKKYSEAETNARKAIELSPTKAAGYLAFSHALYMEEKFNESIAAAQKGLFLVENDVSLLQPSKPEMKKSLNNSIANNYRQMGDTSKQKEYEKIAEDLFNK